MDGKEERRGEGKRTEDTMLANVWCVFGGDVVTGDHLTQVRRLRSDQSGSKIRFPAKSSALC